MTEHIINVLIGLCGLLLAGSACLYVQSWCEYRREFKSGYDTANNYINAGIDQSFVETYLQALISRNTAGAYERGQWKAIKERK